MKYNEIPCRHNRKIDETNTDDMNPDFLSLFIARRNSGWSFGLNEIMLLKDVCERPTDKI